MSAIVSAVEVVYDEAQQGESAKAIDDCVHAIILAISLYLRSKTIEYRKSADSLILLLTQYQQGDVSWRADVCPGPGDLHSDSEDVPDDS